MCVCVRQIRHRPHPVTNISSSHCHPPASHCVTLIGRLVAAQLLPLSAGDWLMTATKWAALPPLHPLRHRHRRRSVLSADAGIGCAAAAPGFGDVRRRCQPSGGPDQHGLNAFTLHPVVSSAKLSGLAACRVLIRARRMPRRSASSNPRNCRRGFPTISSGPARRRRSPPHGWTRPPLRCAALLMCRWSSTRSSFHRPICPLVRSAGGGSAGTCTGSREGRRRILIGSSRVLRRGSSILQCCRRC